MAAMRRRVADILELGRRKSVRRIGYGIAGLVAVMVFGVVGYVAQGWKPFDALYMVVITLSTVGYSEVHPVLGPSERVHTMLVIAFGTFAVAFTVASFIAFITEGEIAQTLGYRRVRRQIDELRNHVIVAGYGRMGSLLCSELVTDGVPFVLIERNVNRVAEIERLGWLLVRGDATEETVLEEAGLTRARRW